MTQAVDRSGNNSKVSQTLDWDAELANRQSWLRGVISAQVFEAQAVDDIFQEVAAAAVEQRAPIADPTKVRGWLYRLAVVHAARYRRRMARKRRHEAGYAQSHDPGKHSSAGDIPLAWLLQKERRQMVQAALRQLAPGDAQLLRLKYFESKSYRELARLLQISEKAVDGRLHRARQRLREKLAVLSNEE